MCGVVRQTSGAFSYTVEYPPSPECLEHGPDSTFCRAPDKIPLTDGCLTRVSGYGIEVSHTVQVDPGFATALGDVESLADCYLTPLEISRDPEAQALVAAWQAAEAANLGIDPSAIQISGISLDDDHTPGCSNPEVQALIGTGGSASFPTLRIRIDNNLYESSLNNPLIHGGEQPCHLTPEEIGSDADAALLASYFTNAVCNRMDVLDASGSTCQVGTGITVSGIDLASCGTQGVDESCTPTDDDADDTIIGNCNGALVETGFKALPSTGLCWVSNVATNSDMPPPAYPQSNRVHFGYDTTIESVSDQVYHDHTLMYPNNLVDTVRDQTACEKTGNAFNATTDRCFDITGAVVHVTANDQNCGGDCGPNAGLVVPISVENCPHGMNPGLCLPWATEMCENTGNVYSPVTDIVLRRFYCERVYVKGYPDEIMDDPFSPLNYGINGTCTYTMSVPEADSFLTSPEVEIQVPESFANGLGSAGAYMDCHLEPAELSPAGSAFMSEVLFHEARLLDTPDMCIATQQVGFCVTHHSFLPGFDTFCENVTDFNVTEWDSSEIGCESSNLTFIPAVSLPGVPYEAAKCVNSNNEEVGDSSSLTACEQNGNTFHVASDDECIDEDGNAVLQWGGRWGDASELACEHGDSSGQQACEQTGFTFVEAIAPDEMYPYGQPARCMEFGQTQLLPGYAGWIVANTPEAAAACENTGHSYTAPVVSTISANLTNFCGLYVPSASANTAQLHCEGAPGEQPLRDGAAYGGVDFQGYLDSEYSTSQCTFIVATEFPTSNLELVGISLDADTDVGCQTSEGLGGGVEIALGAELVGALTGNLGDMSESSTISADDIDLDDPNDPLAMLAQNFLNAVCVSMGMEPGSEECDAVELDGISFSFCSASGVSGVPQEEQDACAAVEGNSREACLNTNPGCRFAMDPECGDANPAAVCGVNGDQPCGSAQWDIPPTGGTGADAYCEDETCMDPAGLCRNECYAVDDVFLFTNAAVYDTYNPTCSASFGTWLSDGRRRMSDGSSTVAYDDLSGHVKVKPIWKYKNSDRGLKVQLSRITPE